MVQNTVVTKYKTAAEISNRAYSIPTRRDVREHAAIKFQAVLDMLHCLYEPQVLATDPLLSGGTDSHAHVQEFWSQSRMPAKWEQSLSISQTSEMT